MVWGGLILPYSCSIKWTDALKLGEIGVEEFHETVNTEVKLGLIFIPVEIDGKMYRFLFDSGAPFSISQKLQDRMEYEAISRGHIVDSDKNRTKVEYVQVDTLLIGGIPFINQTAFVGDFESNPIIGCLEVDGIIGSNLMRHCNWTIDYQNKEIAISSDSRSESMDGEEAIPFRSDKQFNIRVDMKMGGLAINNLRIDYGSNGTLSLPDDVFSTLRKKGEIGQTYNEVGVRASGLIGEPVSINRSVTYVDTLRFGHLAIDSLEIRSGGKGLIGTEILSRYVVHIDWEDRNLYLEEFDSISKSLLTYGFKVGYSDQKELYVLSVIENSIAFELGIQPDMQLTALDTLNFLENHSFCDYINYMDDGPKAISIELKDQSGKIVQLDLEKRSLWNKYN